MKGRQGSRANRLAEQMAKWDKGESNEVKDACGGWGVHVGRMHMREKVGERKGGDKQWNRAKRGERRQASKDRRQGRWGMEEGE